MSIEIGSNDGVVSRSVKLFDSETVLENHIHAWANISPPPPQRQRKEQSIKCYQLHLPFKKSIEYTKQTKLISRKNS